MFDKIIESLAPTKKQKFLYSLLGILWLGLIPPPPDWLPWVSLSTLVPMLDTDKATILLLLSTILLSYSVFLLRKEKEAEIGELGSKLASCKSACETLSKTLATRNGQISKLQTQLRLQEVKDESIAKLNKNVVVKFDFPTNKGNT